MNDDVIAYQLGELVEMQAVRKRGPMIDRDRLREALEWHDRLGRAGMLNVDPRIEAVVEAARLVASETTLIVEKVDGEWPDFDISICDINGQPIPMSILFDWIQHALLAQQPGDTK